MLQLSLQLDQNGALTFIEHPNREAKSPMIIVTQPIITCSDVQRCAKPKELCAMVRRTSERAQVSDQCNEEAKPAPWGHEPDFRNRQLGPDS